MKLTKRIAALVILSVGVFMNIFIDTAQASDCQVCTSEYHFCKYNCHTLVPQERLLCIRQCNDELDYCAENNCP